MPAATRGVANMPLRLALSSMASSLSPYPTQRMSLVWVQHEQAVLDAEFLEIAGHFAADMSADGNSDGGVRSSAGPTVPRSPQSWPGTTLEPVTAAVISAMTSTSSLRVMVLASWLVC